MDPIRASPELETIGSSPPRSVTAADPVPLPNQPTTGGSRAESGTIQKKVKSKQRARRGCYLCRNVCVYCWIITVILIFLGIGVAIHVYFPILLAFLGFSDDASYQSPPASSFSLNSTNAKVSDTIQVTFNEPVQNPVFNISNIMLNSSMVTNTTYLILVPILKAGRYNITYNDLWQSISINQNMLSQKDIDTINNTISHILSINYTRYNILQNTVNETNLTTILSFIQEYNIPASIFYINWNNTNVNSNISNLVKRDGDDDGSMSTDQGTASSSDDPNSNLKNLATGMGVIAGLAPIPGTDVPAIVPVAAFYNSWLLLINGLVKYASNYTFNELFVTIGNGANDDTGSINQKRSLQTILCDTPYNMTVYAYGLDNNDPNVQEYYLYVNQISAYQNQYSFFESIIPYSMTSPITSAEIPYGAYEIESSIQSDYYTNEYGCVTFSGSKFTIPSCCHFHGFLDAKVLITSELRKASTSITLDLQCVYQFKHLTISTAQENSNSLNLVAWYCECFATDYNSSCNRLDQACLQLGNRSESSCLGNYNNCVYYYSIFC